MLERAASTMHKWRRIYLHALLMFASFTFLAKVYVIQGKVMTVTPNHRKSQKEGGVRERRMTSQEETAQCGVSKSGGLTGQSFAAQYKSKSEKGGI